MTDNKKAYVGNLIGRPDSAIFSLINSIDYKYLDHVKKHLTIESEMLGDKLISLKKQCSDMLTALCQLQNPGNQDTDVLFIESYNFLHKQWLAMVTKTNQLQEEINQYDKILKILSVF